MKTEEFINVVTSPREWRRRSVWLRRSADLLRSSFVNEMSLYLNSIRDANSMLERALTEAIHGDTAYSNATEDEVEIFEDHLDRARGFLSHYHMLIGLSVETALKAHLLESRPGTVRIATVVDGSGKVERASVKAFGTDISKSHDLVKLAAAAGVFAREPDPIFESEDDFSELHKILSYLTEMTLWRARYPTPLSVVQAEGEQVGVAGQGMSSRLRQLLLPLLDRYQAEPDDTAI